MLTGCIRIPTPATPARIVTRPDMDPGFRAIPLDAGVTPLLIRIPDCFDTFFFELERRPINELQCYHNIVLSLERDCSALSTRRCLGRRSQTPPVEPFSLRNSHSRDRLTDNGMSTRF